MLTQWLTCSALTSRNLRGCRRRPETGVASDPCLVRCTSKRSLEHPTSGRQISITSDARQSTHSVTPLGGDQQVERVAGIDRPRVIAIDRNAREPPANAGLSIDDIEDRAQARLEAGLQLNVQFAAGQSDITANLHSTCAATVSVEF